MRKYHLPPHWWRLKRSVVSRYVQHFPPRLRRIERRTERSPDGSAETVPLSSRGALRRENTRPSASAEENAATGAVVSCAGGGRRRRRPGAGAAATSTRRTAERTWPGLRGLDGRRARRRAKTSRALPSAPTVAVAPP